MIKSTRNLKMFSKIWELFESLMQALRSILGMSPTTTPSCDAKKLIQLRPNYWAPQNVYFIELDELEVVALNAKTDAAAVGRRSASALNKTNKGL